MKIEQCNNGHYFDADTHTQYIYCADETSEKPRQANMTLYDYACPYGNGYNDSKLGGRLCAEKGWKNPVLGWLIRIDKTHSGDFDYYPVLDTGSSNSEIWIRWIENDGAHQQLVSISIFDKALCISPSGRRDKYTVRLNGQALSSMAELQSHDIIEIGDSIKLLFVPLQNSSAESASAMEGK